MQIVFQDPFGSLSPRLSVGQIVEEGLRVHGLGERAAERAAADRRGARARSGSTRRAATATRTSSRAASASASRIARAMVLRPRLVVLDEPTSALDMSVQAQIVDLLRDLQARHRLAYLFISHDLRVVRALSDEVIVMRGGRGRRGRDRRQEIFERPQQPYTRALMAAAFDIAPVEA